MVVNNQDELHQLIIISEAAIVALKHSDFYKNLFEQEGTATLALKTEEERYEALKWLLAKSRAGKLHYPCTISLGLS